MYQPAPQLLRIRHELPPELLEVKASELHRVLGGPTLIHLPGRREPALFVAVLLHGNEDTGFSALQQVLRNYQRQPLPRALSVFIGNTEAAQSGLRRLPQQPDYNRVWPGHELAASDETLAMAQVVEQMRTRGVFASVDVHNNTGLNPHYACVNRLDTSFLQLATLFSRTVVYFTRPLGVQSLAFADLCPAVTVECGLRGERSGIAHATDFIDACLRLSHIPEHPVAEHDIDLFHTVATIKIDDAVDFDFDHSDKPLRLLPDLDQLNFRELPPGTSLGEVNGLSEPPLRVTDEQGNEVASRYFLNSDGQIITVRPVIPSMFTLNKAIVRQDCLGYLMERLPLPHKH